MDQIEFFTLFSTLDELTFKLIGEKIPNWHPLANNYGRILRGQYTKKGLFFFKRLDQIESLTLFSTLDELTFKLLLSETNP